MSVLDVTHTKRNISKDSTLLLLPQNAEENVSSSHYYITVSISLSTTLLHRDMNSTVMCSVIHTKTFSDSDHCLI